MLVHDAILVISQVLNNVIKDNKWIWRNTNGVTASNSETVLEYAKKASDYILDFNYLKCISLF